jgi:hypothetical protein
MKRQTIADSVLIALLAVAVSLGSVGLLFTRELPLLDELAYLGMGFCGAPAMALLNIFFIVRDRRNGRERAAGIAAVLSLVAAFVGALPLLLAD